jgi:phage terminase large subunit GpA-like protein
MPEWTKAGERVHRAIAAAFRPPPELTVSAWADERRILSPESSAEPGRWRTSRVEYLRGIMDAVTDPSVQKIVVMKSSQVGYTTGIIGNVLGYFIDQDPSAVLVILPTLEMGEAWSKDFLAPMIRDTPCLHDKVRDPRDNRGDNSLRRKAYPGGQLTIIGANSPSALRMRPIRIVASDEIDSWPISVGQSGDPQMLAENRSQTFWNRKCLVGSTPLEKTTSVILREYEKSDRREYHVPCPHCGELQTLKWRSEGDVRIHWDKGPNGEHLPETARYVCEICGTLWSDSERHSAVQQGKWIAANPGGSVAGFRISSLYSPFLSLSDIVKKFLACKDDIDMLKVFTTETLGEAWEEFAEKVDSGSLISRGENYSPQTVPASVAFVTAGVDTQADRLEVQVIGWGVDEESWMIAHEVLHGDPAQPAIWQELDSLLLTQMHKDNGRELRIQAACIDTGGHHANYVHMFCRQRRARHIYPTKGIAGPRPIWPRRASITHDKRSQVFLIGVDTSKDTIYSRLRIGKPGPGYIHFPVGQGFDQDFFAQLTSEQVVTRKREGRSYRVWVLPPGRRNEGLDCAVLAMAARDSIRIRIVSEQDQTTTPPTPPPPEHAPPIVANVPEELPAPPPRPPAAPEAPPLTAEEAFRNACWARESAANSWIRNGRNRGY